MDLFPQQNNSYQKLNVIWGLVAGTLFIAGGFWVRQIQAHERVSLKETEGKVIDNVRRRERSKNSISETETYAPVIEFLANGEPTRFTGKYKSNYSIKGLVVVVRYDPLQPQTTARVVDPFEGLTPWGMFAMGGFSLFFSLTILFSQQSPKT